MRADKGVHSGSNDRTRMMLRKLSNIGAALSVSLFLCVLDTTETPAEVLRSEWTPSIDTSDALVPVDIETTTDGELVVVLGEHVARERQDTIRLPSVANARREGDRYVFRGRLDLPPGLEIASFGTGPREFWAYKPGESGTFRNDASVTVYVDGAFTWSSAERPPSRPPRVRVVLVRDARILDPFKRGDIALSRIMVGESAYDVPDDDPLYIRASTLSSYTDRHVSLLERDDETDGPLVYVWGPGQTIGPLLMDLGEANPMVRGGTLLAAYPRLDDSGVPGPLGIDPFGTISVAQDHDGYIRQVWFLDQKSPIPSHDRLWQGDPIAKADALTIVHATAVIATGGAIELRSSNTGELRTTISTAGRTVRQLAIDDGRKLLASRQSEARVALIDLQGRRDTQLVRHRLDWEPLRGPSPAEEEAAGGLSFSRDLRWVATGASDGTVRVFDTESGEAVDVLQGHEGPVLDVAFGEGATLFSTGADRRVLRHLIGSNSSPAEIVVFHEGWVRNEPNNAVSSDMEPSSYRRLIRR